MKPSLQTSSQPSMKIISFRLIAWRTGSKFWKIIHEQNSVISKTYLSLLIISILINVPVHYIQNISNKIPRNI